MPNPSQEIVVQKIEQLSGDDLGAALDAARFLDTSFPTEALLQDEVEPLLHMSYKHKAEPVRRLIARKLLDLSSFGDDGPKEFLVGSRGYGDMLFSMVGDDELSVSKVACLAVVKIIAYSAANGVKPPQETWSTLRNINVLRIIDASQDNPAVMKYLNDEANLLEVVFAGLGSDDVLAGITYVAALVPIVTTVGVAVVPASVLGYISAMLQCGADAMVQPFVVKAVAAIAAASDPLARFVVEQGWWEKISQLMITGDDCSATNIEALGALSCRPGGMQQLRPEHFALYHSALGVSSTRQSALESIATLFSITSKDDVFDGIFTTEAWATIIWNLRTHHAPEIRHALWSLFWSVTQHAHPTQCLLEHIGFAQYLAANTKELSHETSELKYGVVQHIVTLHRVAAKEVLTETTFSQLASVTQSGVATTVGPEVTTAYLDQ